MHCSIWQPAQDVVGPCAELSFSYSEREDARVTMHFSLQPGLPNRDLSLRFHGMVAMLWELEGPGVSALPRNLPKCTASQWRNWTFPLVSVEGSDWLAQYQAIYPHGSVPLAHYLLISMNDVLQLIARRDVFAEWVPGLLAEPVT